MEGKAYRYLAFGKGQEKILLLWGLASIKESAAAFVSSFFPNGSFIVPEYPHHYGFEDTSFDVSSIRSLSNYLIPLLHNENFDDLYVIGFSMGGLIGVDLANLSEQKLNLGIKVKKLAVWASPILGYEGISDVPRSLLDLYLKVSDERLVSLHNLDILKMVLEKRKIKLFHPFWFKKYLKAVKNFTLSKFPESVLQIYLYDPADVVISSKNIDYLKKMATHKAALIKTIQIKGSGHLGTKNGFVMAIKAIKEFFLKYSKGD